MSVLELRPCDVDTIPLEGSNLIEASAGTGKTHAITRLYLRLLLEKAMRVDQILVVTYTIAATDELRGRIRERLSESRSQLLRGDLPDDLVSLGPALADDRDLLIRRIENSLRSFDEAAIFTIHGFCQRVLSQNAFESRLPFEAEIIPDESDILKLVVQDFWRRRLSASSTAFLRHMLGEHYGPDGLESFLSRLGSRLSLEVAGGEQCLSGKVPENECAEAMTEVRILWKQQRSEVARILRSSRLRAAKYPRHAMDAWLLEVDEWIGSGVNRLGHGLPGLRKLTSEALREATLRGSIPPRHPFFDACQRLCAAQHTLLESHQVRTRAVLKQLFDAAGVESEKWKSRQGCFSFDDLLEKLDRALGSPAGSGLARALRERFPAALIDEFQDTDPTQYSIFNRIYGRGDCALFFVGDPKQAIYSFRGADLFAYLNARSRAMRGYTLDVNWRSHPLLIRGVNEVFQAVDASFLIPEISFRPAAPAPRNVEPLIEEGRQRVPLRIWIPPSTGSKPLAKSKAAKFASRATAAEIARLVRLGNRGQASIGERPLAGADIAVLVRTHRQGRLIREDLRRFGIPSVQQTQEDVFGTIEALEVERVLRAVAEPARVDLVRAALSTETLGWNAERIDGLSRDDRAWSEVSFAFHAYHQAWMEKGFLPMFHGLLLSQDVPARLLRRSDGERRLTNLFHIEELVQEASRDFVGFDDLICWVAERRNAVSQEEDRQLRLESDDRLVKVVTLHKSKGLEYEIVFCPFLWDGRLWSEKDAHVVCHDHANGGNLVLDLGSPRQPELRREARKEEMAENLRLLYVALTRARQRCYLVWGAIRDADTSPLAWLLHPPEDARLADPIEALAQHYKSLSIDRILEDMSKLESRSRESIRVEQLPEEVPVGAPVALSRPQTCSRREFRGEIAEGRRLSSYSSLKGADSSAPGRSGGRHLTTRGPGSPKESIYDFPRGARAGACLHAFFERVDFMATDDSVLERLSRTVLSEYGFDEDWVPVVVDLFWRAVTVPLGRTEAISRSEPPRLRDVGRHDRLDELEFYYPIRELDRDSLATLLASHRNSDPGFSDVGKRLSFSLRKGYMRGYIDLVFRARGRYYLADFKSNWLGTDADDYSQPVLREVMSRHSYGLQSLIYSLALHRYLESRLPDYSYENHFGGVFYVFLRGLDEDGSRGIVESRPSPSLIRDLDSCLRPGTLEPSEVCVV